VFVLCDTCVLLMLLRIAPDMLRDARFNCVTPSDVREEFIRTQKFKEKYPWRDRYKSNIKPLPASLASSSEFKNALQTVEAISFSINKRTKRPFGLSRVDRIVAACVVANEYKLSTGDRDLRDFLKQEFDVVNVSPLEIINDWLTRNLIGWDDEKQGVLEDWRRCEEHSQPENQIAVFERKTGRTYPAY